MQHWLLAMAQVGVDRGNECWGEEMHVAAIYGDLLEDRNQTFALYLQTLRVERGQCALQEMRTEGICPGPITFRIF
jgi:hypothetical protein